MTSAAAAGLVWTAALSAAAPEPPARAAGSSNSLLVPTLAVETGQYREALEVDLGDTVQRETRSLWVSRLAFGVDYRAPSAWAVSDRLRASASVGVGLVHALGQWPIHARQEIAYVLVTPRQGMSLAMGLGTGVQINVSNLRRSYWEVGVPVRLAVPGDLEIIYYPMFAFSIGSEQRETFAGRRSHGVDTGLAPFNLMVRIRLAGLGFYSPT